MVDVFKTIVDFAGNVSETISGAFRAVQHFFQWINIVSLQFAFWLLVLLFVMIIFACMALPIYLYPYWIKVKALYYKFFEKIGDSYNRDR